MQDNMILVVDDDPINLTILEEILKEVYTVFTASSGEQALQFLNDNKPDVILLDYDMPGMNGYDVIRVLKKSATLSDIPVIFLTAQEGRDNEQKAFELGAVDYILKPISAGVVLSRINLHVELENYRKNLEELVMIKTTQLQNTQDSIVDILSNVTAYRDNETGAHIKRTTFYTEKMVNKLMELKHPDYIFTKEYAINIIKSAKLHDIGKVAVPDGILLKPGKLTADEFEIIKKHTTLGAQLLDDAIQELGSDSSFLLTAREIVISHHEKWDGNGYPYHISGHNIPISGRIMAIADVYDALVSERPYKKPFTHEETMDIIIKSSGNHFDPNIIEMVMPVMGEFPAIVSKYRDEHYSMRLLGSS